MQSFLKDNESLSKMFDSSSGFVPDT